MQIPVLVEPGTANGFRARSGEPFALTAEGPTAEEAVRKVREQLRALLAAGGQVIPVEIQTADNPWLKIAGMFKDEPLFDEWQEAMRERRRQIDADPTIR